MQKTKIAINSVWNNEESNNRTVNELFGVENEQSFEMQFSDLSYYLDIVIQESTFKRDN